jgi:hypothetical protein
MDLAGGNRPTMHEPAPVDPVKMALVARANPNKSAVLVAGRPGSGKSFVLVQLLAELSSSSDVGNSWAPAPEVLRPTPGVPDGAPIPIDLDARSSHRKRP